MLTSVSRSRLYKVNFVLRLLVKSVDCVVSFAWVLKSLFEKLICTLNRFQQKKKPLKNPQEVKCNFQSPCFTLLCPRRIISSRYALQLPLHLSRMSGTRLINVFL